MVTRERVRGLLATGNSYEEVAAQLGLPAGEVYLIATGHPADGSQPDRGSTQGLANPPHENPTRKEHVQRWAVARATGDRHMQDAARAAAEEGSD